MRGPNCHPAGG